jgi:hypothetical protein
MSEWKDYFPGEPQARAKAPDRPEVLQVNFDDIPGELKALDRWCAWRLKLREDVWAKLPCDRNGHALRWSNPEAWISFAQAREIYESSGRGFRVCLDGVGFFLGDGVSGGDFDDVRNSRTGVITPEALSIMRAFRTYAEVSPSGTGLKFLYRGSAPTLKGAPLKTTGSAEFYSSGRFFALTGQRLKGFPRTLADCAAKVIELQRKLGAVTTANGNGAWKPPKSDEYWRALVTRYADGLRHDTRIELLGHFAAKGVSRAIAEEIFVVFEQAAAILQKRKPTPPDVVRKKVASIYALHALGLGKKTTMMKRALGAFKREWEQVHGKENR